MSECLQPTASRPHVESTFQKSVTGVNESHYFKHMYALGQGARPREPHDWPLRLCRDARHCSKTAGHLSRQLLKKEQKHLTTHHIQSLFNNRQNHLQSRSPLSDSTLLPFQHHSHTTPRRLLELTSSSTAPSEALAADKELRAAPGTFLTNIDTLHKPLPCPMRRP